MFFFCWNRKKLYLCSPNENLDINQGRGVVTYAREHYI